MHGSKFCFGVLFLPPSSAFHINKLCCAGGVQFAGIAVDQFCFNDSSAGLLIELGRNHLKFEDGQQRGWCSKLDGEGFCGVETHGLQFDGACHCCQRIKDGRDRSSLDNASQVLGKMATVHGGDQGVVVGAASETKSEWGGTAQHVVGRSFSPKIDFRQIPVGEQFIEPVP